MRVGRPRLSRAGEQPVAYAFSRNAHEHVLLTDPASISEDETGSLPDVTLAAVPAAFFRAKDSPLRSALRLDTDRACFALFPRHAGELRLNALLRAAACSAEFDAADAAHALGTNVVALALPGSLATLLASVDCDHLHAANLELLALVGEDEDDASYEDMRQELEPTMWSDLEAYIARRASNPAPSHIMGTVEELLRLCYQTPWHIPVSYLHIPPTAFSSTLCPMVIDVDQTSVVSQGTARKEDALWHLFVAWHPVRAALVRWLGLSGRTVATALLDAEAVGDIDRAWARAWLVVAAARTASPGTQNLFAALPPDLVAQFLAPHVLFASLSVPANSLQLPGGNSSEFRVEL
jgi:hypothetical protein